MPGGLFCLGGVTDGTPLCNGPDWRGLCVLRLHRRLLPALGRAAPAAADHFPWRRLESGGCWQAWARLLKPAVPLKSALIVEVFEFPAKPRGHCLLIFPQP